MSERVLVTGVLGCLGAWVARAVVADGDDVVGYDLGENTARLDLVLGQDAARVTLVRGDITELDTLERVLDEHEITRVVHLAALQVPFMPMPTPQVSSTTRAALGASARSTPNVPINASPIVIARRVPSRAERYAATGANSPMHSTGIVPRRPTRACDAPVSSWI